MSKRFGATRALDRVSLAIAPGTSHALVGCNGAGKSTLVDILAGMIGPDSGSVWFGGRPAPPLAHRKRWAELVQCVYQRSTVIPQLTVGENLFLTSRARGSRSRVSWKRIRVEGRALLDEWGLDVAVDAKASTLSSGHRQLVEVARALHAGSRFIVLDEPTAQLEAGEIATLFERLRHLRAGGVTFLYISHHLPEIYEVCDEVTVLRDGSRVASMPVSTVSRADLITAMVGDKRQLGYLSQSRRPRVRHHAAGQPTLRVADLSMPGRFESISFEVYAGERVGIAGIAGCGKVELAAAIAGLAKRRHGRVLVDGVTVRPGRVDEAIRKGIGYVPGDRHADGFCPNLTIEENLTTSILRALGPFGLISTSRRRAQAAVLMRDLAIVARSSRQPTGELSGGNQQKTVLGRALASDPKVLVLVTPTAGVDVASKDALFERIRRQRAAALIVTDDLDELTLCDRVLVMFDGRLRRELGADRTDESVLAAMEGVVQ